MDAELRGNAARLDGEPGWRFGPAGGGSNVLKTSTLHTQYDLQSREFSCIKIFRRVGFTQVSVIRHEAMGATSSNCWKLSRQNNAMTWSAAFSDAAGSSLVSPSRPVFIFHSRWGRPYHG